MTCHDRGASWFLAQLKPNCGNIANKNLRRQGFETFLPLEERTIQQNGKFITAMRPLFPGYVFVLFDVTRGLWRAVSSTYGIARLVSFGSSPFPVVAVPILLALASFLLVTLPRLGGFLPVDPIALRNLPRSA